MIWSIACMAKLKVMNSTMGLRPAIAVPIPSPAKPCSVIGVSMTRAAPNSCSRPCVTLYAPWYSATSSPITNTAGSRRISSAMASRNASRTVIVTISVPSGTSGSGNACCGGGSTLAGFGDAGARASAAGDLAAVVGAGAASGAFGGLAGRGVLAIRQDDGDRCVDRDVLGSLGHQNLAQRALVDRLDLHRGFVGLDLGDHIAGFDLVALVFDPLGEIALLHGWRQGWHTNFNRHFSILKAPPNYSRDRRFLDTLRSGPPVNRSLESQ